MVVDPRTGQPIYQVGPANRMFVPGSTSKMFGVPRPGTDLGADSRITTPVLALGARAGSALNGSLVFVGKGDLTLAGRTKPDGTLDWTPLDHTVANAIPGATLTPENPLAGIDMLARQVRDPGIAGRSHRHSCGIRIHRIG